MALVNETIFCEDCGAEFEVGVLNIADVTSNPELREKIVTGEFFEFQCPNCGQTEVFYHPVMYVDRMHKFMIQFCDESFAAMHSDEKDYFKNFMHGAEEFEDYLKIFATSVENFIEKIIWAERGLDFKVMLLGKAFFETEFKEHIKNQSYYDNSVNVWTKLDDDGDLVVYTAFAIPRNLTKKAFEETKKVDYENLVKETSVYVEEMVEILTYSLNDSQVNKFLKMFAIKEMFKAKVSTFCVVYDENRHYVLLSVPNKYKVELGSEVVFRLSDFNITGTVKKVFQMNEYESPYYFSNYPEIIGLHKLKLGNNVKIN